MHTESTDAARSTQVGGDHYQKRIQPWDVIEVYKLDFWLGNVIKYVCRNKNGEKLQDLRKARHYLDYSISRLEDQEKARP